MPPFPPILENIVSVLLEGIFNGLSTSSVLLIAALGLAIVFGLMGVINLAHGELMMLGAYSTFVVQNLFQGFGEPWFDLYIFAALPVAFLVAAIAGLVLERQVIRYLYGRPLETLLATWGVSLILQQFVRSVNWIMVLVVGIFLLLYFGGTWLIKRQAGGKPWLGKAQVILFFLSVAIASISGFAVAQGNSPLWNRAWFGARNVNVSAPTWLRGGFAIGTFQVPSTRIFIIFLTLLCLLAVYLIFYRSNWGLRIRAVTQNRGMSACLGIPTGQVDALTFALGSGLAGIAGCAISFLGAVGPNIGQNYIINTFMVVVVGGVGNLLGTIIASLAIGVSSDLIGSGTLIRLFPAEGALQPLYEFFTFFATTSMARVLVFALIILFLQIKPAGIFPPKGRTAEL
nr:urea ABC transporter permease subunit UrtB [Synechocystis salina]